MNDDSPLVDALDLAEQVTDPDQRTHLFDAVQQTAAVVGLLDAESDPEQLGLILATLDEAHRAAAWAVKQRILAVLPYGGEIPVSDVGTVSVKTPAPKVRYDNPRLLSVLAARVADEAVDPLTGEIPPVAVIAGHVATAVAEATGCAVPSFASWRVGALKSHGLDRGDFEIEKQWSDPAVTLRLDKKGK